MLVPVKKICSQSLVEVLFSCFTNFSFLDTLVVTQIPSVLSVEEVNYMKKSSLALTKT